jgi:hypothetical protein
LISPEAIRSAFETADVILNTSSSEGLSNSLLGAIAAGHLRASQWPGPETEADGLIAAYMTALGES